MRKGGVRGPLPQENEGRGRRGVDPSGSRRSRRDRQLAPHPPHRCLLRSRFAVEGRTLRLDSLGLAFFFAGIRRKEEILLKRSAREGDRWWRMGASRATWTLAFSIVSVGAAIALVHGMQTEERRRLHQVGWNISTHARTRHHHHSRQPGVVLLLGARSHPLTHLRSSNDYDYDYCYEYILFREWFGTRRCLPRRREP